MVDGENTVINRVSRKQDGSLRQCTKFSVIARAEITVVLGTAIVRVQDSLGGLQTVRVLLDSGFKFPRSRQNMSLDWGCHIKSRIEVTGLSQQPVNKV